MIEPEQPLLFFDTGVGGLSVFSKVRAVLPNAAMIYAADYAGIPYGEKSEMEVATRVCALLGRLCERYRPRLAVIACNTASVIALEHARSVLGVPIVGTVPAIKPAALASKTGVIGLLGTAATIRQPYVDRLEAEFVGGKTLLRFAAPDLVYAAEEKMRGEKPEAAIFEKAIAGLCRQPGGDALDHIILGCTHFPLVRAELSDAAKALGLPSCLQFIDGSDGIARRIKTLTYGQNWPSSPTPGRFVTTGDIMALAPYRPRLSDYGLTEIAAL